MDRFSFGDSPEMADRLLGLVLAGKKTATTSALSDPTIAHNDIGKRWIVLDGKGKERAIIETAELRIVPFMEVDEAFARDEGEGDLTLSYWRKVHEDFFRREGVYSPDMKVVCERFKLVEAL